MAEIDQPMCVCKDEKMWGVVVKGCGWKGYMYELSVSYHNSISSDHPLSGWRGTVYCCPKCGKKLYEDIVEMS
jgi:hypothetical protein